MDYVSGLRAVAYGLCNVLTMELDSGAVYLTHHPVWVENGYETCLRSLQEETRCYKVNVVEWHATVVFLT